MESKSHLRLTIFAAILIVVASFIFIYREALFPERPAFESKIGSVIPDLPLRSESAESGLYRILEGRGSKKTILALWATWCAPCVNELPLIEAALPRLAQQGIQVLLVNYDGGNPDKTIPEVKAWLVSHNLKLQTYYDFKEETLEKLGISALPFAIGVNTQRKIEWMEMGELDWKREFKIKD